MTPADRVAAQTPITRALLRERHGVGERAAVRDADAAAHAGREGRGRAEAAEGERGGGEQREGTQEGQADRRKAQAPR
jgi:hypothetical protein